MVKGPGVIKPPCMIDFADKRLCFPSFINVSSFLRRAVRPCHHSYAQKWSSSELIFIVKPKGYLTAQLSGNQYIRGSYRRLKAG